MSTADINDRIESHYPANYGDAVVSRIYDQIHKHRLALVVGFRGIGKSSIANFLAYSTSHITRYSRHQPTLFCKFSFNSLTNQSPKSFIFHLISNINAAIEMRKIGIAPAEIKSNMSEYDTLNVLRNLVRGIGNHNYKLVLIFDPAESLIKHEQRHRIYQYLRHLFDHNRTKISYVFFSNNPNIIKDLNESNFGELASSINSSVIWFTPHSIEEYRYYLYHDYNLWQRLFNRRNNKIERYIYEMSGGIAAIMNYFRDIKQVTPQVMYQALADQAFLNICEKIITSFNYQQQVFLYYLANEIEQPVYILRSDVDILEKSGIIELNNQVMRYEIKAQILIYYLRLPGTYQLLFSQKNLSDPSR